jgi:hypothetical protein
VALLLASSCARHVHAFVPTPWPADQLAIIVVVDGEGRVTQGPLLFPPGRAVELRVAAGSPVRMYALTYAPSTSNMEGIALLECGARLSAGAGGDEPLPSPMTAWESMLFDAQSTGGLAFGPETDLPTFALAFNDCSRPSPCAKYSASVLDAPSYLETLSVVAVDDDLAYFMAAPMAGSHELILGKIDHGQVTLLPGDPRLRSGSTSFVWDQRATIFGLDGGSVFRLDRSGRLVQPPYGAAVHQLYAGDDGTVLELDERQMVARLSTTSTAFVPRPDFPTRATHLAIAGRDRIFATDGSSIYFYDGVNWTTELAPIPESDAISVMDADREAATYSVPLEYVRVRDAVSKSWALLPPPFSTYTHVRDLKEIGGGRVLVVGEIGGLSLWTGQQWCQLHPTGTGTASINVLSVPPDRRVAYASANGSLGPGGKAVLIRIDYPSP